MNSARHKLFRLSWNKRVAKLPAPYLDYFEKVRAPPERVHDDTPETKYLDYNQDHETGYVYRVPDQRIHTKLPPSALTKGLWGGLAMVEGFEKPKRLKPRISRLWYPKREKHTFYSEILDCHINIEITERTLQLIDKHNGFEFYILETRPQDLRSDFGVRLQRKLLLALHRDDCSEFAKSKYKDFIKPMEDIQWHGLQVHEALTKVKLMRIEESIAPPLKLTYGQQLLDELKKRREAIAST